MSESKEKHSQSLNESSKKKEILIGDYILKHTIGKGTFSRVKLGINKNTGEKVAIKILDKRKIVEKSDLERILREMKMLSELENEHIIKHNTSIIQNINIVINFNLFNFSENNFIFKFV